MNKKWNKHCVPVYDFHCSYHFAHIIIIEESREVIPLSSIPPRYFTCLVTIISILDPYMRRSFIVLCSKHISPKRNVK